MNTIKTIGAVSLLSGVSIRALRHYDAIGLLCPSEKTEAGYRLYSDSDIEKLQTILLFKELDFPLREIKTILNASDYDMNEAIRHQIRLLQLRKKRIDDMIRLANTLIDKGEEKMSFEVFDKTEIDQYKQEVLQKWGNTDAYKEYENRSHDKNGSYDESLMNQFVQFGKIKTESPQSTQAQNTVKALQDFITDNYYHCTDAILKSLGEMYIKDERFKNNIDAAGGEGTARFVKEAIDCFCK